MKYNYFAEFSATLATEPPPPSLPCTPPPPRQLTQNMYIVQHTHTHSHSECGGGGWQATRPLSSHPEVAVILEYRMLNSSISLYWSITLNSSIVQIQSKSFRLWTAGMRIQERAPSSGSSIVQIVAALSK